MSQVSQVRFYRLPDVMRELGVRSEHTIDAWEQSCPYLEGRPFRSKKETIQVTQANQWGSFERPYSVKVWPPELVELVERRQREIEAGRYVREDGKPVIFKKIALAKVREVRPRSDGQYLEKIARGERCASLPGPGVPVEAFRLNLEGRGRCRPLWFVEADIDGLCAALRNADRGVFGSGRDVTLAGHAVLKRFGWHDAKLRRWENSCQFHPERKLDPVWLPGGRGQKKGRLRTYRLRDLVIIRRNRRKPFEGVYLEPGGERRLNLTRLAEEFPQFTRSTWARFVEATEFHAAGKLPAEPRPRPPHGREELTVLESEAEAILEKVKEKLATLRPAGDWNTAKQLMARHKVTDESEQIKFNALLSALQDAGVLHTQKFFVRLDSRAKLRRVKHFEGNELDPYLEGCTVAEALDRIEAALANEHVDTSGQSDSVGRPEQNQDLLEFARNARNEQPRPSFKQILKRWKDQESKHPIFDAADPYGAFRAAWSRAKKNVTK